MKAQKGLYILQLQQFFNSLCVFLISNFDLNVKTFITQAYIPVALAVVAASVMVFAIGWSTWYVQDRKHLK